MQRLSHDPSWIEVSRAKWMEATGKIIKQAHLESAHKKRLQQMLNDLEECGMFPAIYLFVIYAMANVHSVGTSLS